VAEVKYTVASRTSITWREPFTSRDQSRCPVLSRCAVT